MLITTDDLLLPDVEFHFLFLPPGAGFVLPTISSSVYNINVLSIYIYIYFIQLIFYQISAKIC